MRRPLLCLTLLILTACPHVFAQYLEPIPDRGPLPVHHLMMPASLSGSASLTLMPLSSRDDQGSLALTIGSSVLFGTAGFIVGGFAGSALTDDCGYFDCIEGVIYGILIGTPVGTAVGAHLGNGRRGSLGYDLLAGLGGSAVGTLILAASSDSGIAAVLAGASVVALPVLAERRTAARRARARHVEVAVAPTRHGFGVGLRVTMGG